MLDKTAIRTAVSSDFSSNWKSQVLTELANQGFTQAERDAVEPYLDNIVSVVDSTTDMGLDSYEVEATKEAEASLTNEISNKKAAEEFEASKAKLEAHEVFNARTSLSYKEPIFSEPKFTSPVNIQDANYSVMEDYPDSYGYIDEAKNWVKVNKKSGHVELVHNSGTSIKIDRFGNVTEHIVGKFKRIIEGDMSEEVKGSYDLLVKKSYYIHVAGDFEEKVDKTKTSTIGSSKTETVMGPVSEKYSSTHTMKVSGGSTLDGGPTLSLKGVSLSAEGATVSVEGATVQVDGAIVQVTSGGILMLSGAPLAFIGA